MDFKTDMEFITSLVSCACKLFVSPCDSTNLADPLGIVVDTPGRAREHHDGDDDDDVLVERGPAARERRARERASVSPAAKERERVR